MARPLFPGSFDPPTRGHLDLVERALAMFGQVLVGVGRNRDKGGLFPVEERIALLEAELAGRAGVEVRAFDGLVVDFARASGCDLILRGIRNTRDLEYELDMARTNRTLAGIETLFLPADPALASTSSSLLKDIVEGGGDASPWLSEDVIRKLRARLGRA
ncbi:MAG: pantetheine-phosphate adenylyltransferase [Planctomycetota bacterium]